MFLHPYQAHSYQFLPQVIYTAWKPNPEFLKQFLQQIRLFYRIAGGNAGPEHPFFHQRKVATHKPLSTSPSPILKGSSNKITAALPPRSSLQGHQVTHHRQILSSVQLWFFSGHCSGRSPADIRHHGHHQLRWSPLTR